MEAQTITFGIEIDVIGDAAPIQARVDELQQKIGALITSEMGEFIAA